MKDEKTKLLHQFTELDSFHQELTGLIEHVAAQLGRAVAKNAHRSD